MPLLIILFIGFLTHSMINPSTHASVWDSQKSWTNDEEIKFGQWIESTQVHPQMFSAPSSPYHGVTLDCADLMYALRAIYAFENKLPYQVKNPVASATSKTPFFTNNMALWDKLPPNKRLIKFLNYLNASLGTETLSLFDSYSPTIKSIRSGSFYMWKVVLGTGEIVRHTYVIKSINPKGNFDLIYSTQSAAAAGRALYYHLNTQISSVYAPKIKNWGFRKMKWPQHYQSNGIRPADENLEQYTLAAKLSGKEFFKLIKRTLQKTTETNSEFLKRSVKSLCDQLIDREVEVKSANTFVNSINQRCLNYQEYDAYSTPSRDLAFKKLVCKS